MTDHPAERGRDQPHHRRVLGAPCQRQGLEQGLWNDFGRTAVQDDPGDVFTAVTTQWFAAADSARGRAAIESWARRCPSLAAYRSPAEVVAVINQPGHPDRSCALLAELVVVAEDDHLARLAVLRALLPGIRRAVHRRWRTAAGSGPWLTKADLAADAISAAWEAIRHIAGRAHPLPARLVIRQVERRLRSTHDADRRYTIRAVPTPNIQSIVAEDPKHRDEEDCFAGELLHAVQSGHLDPTSAALAYRIALLGEPATSAGRRYRLDPGQTRETLRLVLEVLAGATRAPNTTDASRPAIHASTEEDPLLPSNHQPAGHSRTPSPAPVIMPLLLTVNQAAQLLGIGRSTLYELIDADEIRSVKVGASRRVPLKAIYEYIDELLTKAQRDHDEVCPPPDHATGAVRQDEDALDGKDPRPPKRLLGDRPLKADHQRYPAAASQFRSPRPGRAGRAQPTLFDDGPRREDVEKEANRG